MYSSMHKPVVVVPNWNGEAGLAACLDSLLAQSLACHIIVVDNGSRDGSLALLHAHYPTIEVIRHERNKGYSGGVNPGFQRAIELGADYVAPFNNDAVADSHWLECLVAYMDQQPTVGIAACKLLSADGAYIDSTGEGYSTWGLPFPRGRGEAVSTSYDEQPDIFGASGGASLYRVDMLQKVGLLDEDFFAYYEDVDLSFRAQLAGWHVRYVPAAVVYHATSTTGSAVKGFFTYQTIKNLPWLLWKNLPAPLLLTVVPRFFMAYVLFIGQAARRGHAWYALRGLSVSVFKLPKKLLQRRQIHRGSVVDAAYIASIMTYDLPPAAHNLRSFRSMLHKLQHRREV